MSHKLSLFAGISMNVLQSKLPVYPDYYAPCTLQDMSGVKDVIIFANEPREITPEVVETVSSYIRSPFPSPYRGEARQPERYRLGSWRRYH
jgi:hypothetical protein